MQPAQNQRAAVLHGQEDVRIESIPLQPLQPGEVRLGIEAALTCGTDLKVFRRGYHARMIVPPAVFGHEMAGTLLETTPHTPEWKPGDRVVVANSAPCDHCFFCRENQQNLCENLLFLNGAYAQSIVIPERLVQKNLLKIQPQTTFAEAALTEPLACVVQGLQDCNLRDGQSVLVLGTGPIGLMFMRLASHAGAEVWAAGRGKERLEAAQRLGASKIIEIPPGTNTAETIRKTGLPPADIVIEAVGRPDVWEAATQLVRKGGKINFFGGCPANTSIQLDTSLIHYSNLTLLASFHHTPKSIRQALNYIESGVIHAQDFVDGSCDLEDLPSLLASMARGNRAIKTLIKTQSFST